MRHRIFAACVVVACFITTISEAQRPAAKAPVQTVLQRLDALLQRLDAVEKRLQNLESFLQLSTVRHIDNRGIIYADDGRVIGHWGIDYSPELTR